MQQTITPNPYVPCRPGWCLAYVNEAFGVRKVYGSATAAWNGSARKHRDYNFPAGVWVPLWFYMPNEPLGHVVLRAPDGTIYSTSTFANTAYHHPNLQHLHDMYAHAGLPLVYLGWTEDVEDTPVMAPSGSLSYAGTTITPETQEEEDMGNVETISDKALEKIADALLDRIRGENTLGQMIAGDNGKHLAVTGLIKALPAAILDKQVPQAGGGTITLGEHLAEGRGHQLQVIGSVQGLDTGGSVDVDALAAALATQLAVTDLAALAAKLQITVKAGE